MSVTLHLGDCLDVMPSIPDASVDAIITDPPYPEIDRPYGRMTEVAWHDMMHRLVPECRRVLKPRGSAVFVLQPNSRKVGSMRPWLWEFMAWACREWNMVQDAWWWNTSSMTIAGSGDKGLMRPSVKACVWLGPPDCYRDQDSVLWDESSKTRINALSDRCNRDRPSGWRGAGKPRFENPRRYEAAARRGGVVPFNVIPMGGGSKDGRGDHVAATPLNLADWWVRYISPEGGVVLDPFSGSGTVPMAALKRGRSAMGIEKMPEYHAIAERRIAAARASTPLLDLAPAAS